MLDSLTHPRMTPEQFREPRWARFLFASQAAAWLWLVVRLYLAYIFIPAGWHKITSGDWLFGDGSPIMGMVGGAATAEGTPGWYVWFLQNVVEPNASLFATLVALGEFAVGLGLLVGLLTGVARHEPGSHHPRPIPCQRMAQRRLDRPRPLVHPPDPPDLLGGLE